MAFNELEQARRNLFRTPRVIKHIGQATVQDPRIVDTACKALLEEGLLPCVSDGKADALAIDGAMVLMALASRQTEADAIVRVLGRLRDMQHQVVVARPTIVSTEPRRLPSDLFVHGVAEVIKQTWQNMRAPIIDEDADIGVSILWGDRGEVLYGVIDYVSEHRKHIYSNAKLPVPPGIADEWDFIELRTVGGHSFSTLSIFYYAKVLKDSAVGTPAELDEP
ncbi:hypothetical protein [Tardiphaga sp.]|jgi:hypothetical protein|uniref:hypothetical protein n=1 Tax=Tardiphaga sp. TaxID=1926292 RepID=UPI0037DA3CB2